MGQIWAKIRTSGVKSEYQNGKDWVNYCQSHPGQRSAPRWSRLAIAEHPAPLPSARPVGGSSGRPPGLHGAVTRCRPPARPGTPREVYRAALEASAPCHASAPWPSGDPLSARLAVLLTARSWTRCRPSTRPEPPRATQHTARSCPAIAQHPARGHQPSPGGHEYGDPPHSGGFRGICLLVCFHIILLWLILRVR